MTTSPLAWRPSRREVTQLGLVLPFLARQDRGRKVATTADGEPHFVDPPGEIPAALQERVDTLAASLASGSTTTNEILADPSTAELRPYPAFRALIETHAATGKAVLVPRGEPGVALTSSVVVLDREKKPYADVRVYAYQTSAKGWYAAEAPHVAGNSGDTKFARLFAHGRTDAEGRCELVSVRPGPYPRSDLPSHIHLVLRGSGGDERGTEIRFEDCPRMTPAEHANSLRSGFVVVPVERLADGSARCSAVFELPPA